MKVRFRAAGPATPATPPPAITPQPTNPPATTPTPPTTRATGASPATSSATPTPPTTGRLPGSGESAIEVIKPGPLATVQDLGRPGFGHLGVPRSGAADPPSLRLANRLAGNPDGAAVLELTLGRAELRFLGQAWVAVAGAPVAVTLHGPDTAAGGTGRTMPHGVGFSVPAGGAVQVGAPGVGLRTYLAVRGGIDVPPVLGSRSADLRSGLGPAPLRSGDVLPVGPAASPARGGPVAGEAVAGEADPGHVTGAALPVAGQPTELRVIPGPRDDWFVPGALDMLCGSTYTVTAASDRTGLRLDGPALRSGRDDELPSEGVVTGSLQVPPGGRPILLLADHPVTGGYPVIAVVVSADVGLAGQLRPGSKLQFTLAADSR
jgi:biotin-dependent carboxylase-like uncharacterized protein